MPNPICYDDPIMIMIHRDYQPEREDEPRFQIGQLVRHKRYHYRGVIVAMDPRCQASEAWYQANQTRPDRDQPWYHVLVDGAGSVTYPAESSLEEDPTREPVVHPLVETFFESFDGTRYIRNQTPWPS